MVETKKKQMSYTELSAEWIRMCVSLNFSNKKKYCVGGEETSFYEYTTK